MDLNKYDKGSIVKKFNQQSEGSIPLDKDDTKKISTISMAHFAVGNSTDFMLGMNTLSKINVENSLVDALAKMDRRQSILMAKILGEDFDELDDGA
tara:strand:+ start:106 stop:393 length:288 start_codon:yes stop_codon:yes gene_type:complete